MYRSSEDRLASWWKSAHRKPLVLRGARQVGKSTLVRQFAASMGLELLEINLEKRPLLQSFATLDPQQILRDIESTVGKSFTPQRSLLFLDEIQGNPQALEALRYFYEEAPKIPVIAAGSLLEFAIEEGQFSMPVGRIEYLHLGPMSFGEFLQATRGEQLWERLNEIRTSSVSPEEHELLLRKWREYLFVGGMPEAVRAYSESGSMLEVRRVQQSILETYRDDFPKYAKKTEIGRLDRVFDYVPRALGQKIKYSNITADVQSKYLKNAIKLLIQARVVLPVFHSDCSGVPLAAGKSDEVYKLYFLDVGLANASMGLKWEDVNEGADALWLQKGAIVEQFVAQHLIQHARPFPELFYWLRDGSAGNAEIDFVWSEGGRVMPLEVKAGKSGSLRSLHQFMHEKKLKQAIRFDSSSPVKQQIDVEMMTGKGRARARYNLESWPVYAVDQVFRPSD
ncbi:ATP-binding protein [Bdellovibrionota bacterium FG-1]